MDEVILEPGDLSGAGHRPDRCGLCHSEALPQAGGVHQPVPAVTQYQSPEFIAAIAYEGADPADDPLWWRSGADSREEYGFWSRRSCGMACLQMVLAHRGQPVPPLQHLMRDGIACGAYRPREDGSVLGLLYAPFLEYVRDTHQLDGAVRPELSLQGLSDELDLGGMVLASVHKEIRRPSLPAPGQGGHLVLVIGRDSRGIHFRNPSGHTEGTRYGLLPAEVFDTFFGRRGVTLRVG